LHELAITAPLRIFTPPDLRGVPAAKGEAHLGKMGCHEASERHREVESHRHISAAMVGEAIDFLVRFPATFAKQHLGELQRGGINRKEPKLIENGLQPPH
jgi:hypothetical protein